MYLSILLISAAIVSTYAALWFRWRRARALLKGLPTFTTLPFIGSFHKFVGGGKAVFQKLRELSEKSNETDLPFLVWAGPVPVLMFIDVEDIKGVTNTFIEKPYYYGFGRIWLGNGLLTAPGPIWKRNIKKLSNTFNTNIVDGYQDVFNAQAQLLVRKLRGEVGRGPFNALEKYLAHTTLETICQTALGVPRISDSIVTTAYYEAFNDVTNLLMKRGFNLLLHLEPVFRLTTTHKELERNMAVIHNVSETIINRRMKEWKEKKTIEGDQKHSSTRFKSFLDFLLELSEGDSSLTPQQIKSEVDTIIVGGQETNASTLSFILLMIGCRPDVQDRMYAEIKEIFGDSKRAIHKEDLAKMAYCEAVIYETLRLYPPVPTVMRHADKDLKLKSCTIPKDTICGINVWGSGRSQRTWGPDVDQYRPERWLRPGYMASHAPLLMAFSYGRRSCIGKKYAMALMKTVLAYCVRELHFSSEADKIQLTLDLVLRAIHGHLITVQSR